MLSLLPSSILMLFMISKYLYPNKPELWFDQYSISYFFNLKTLFSHSLIILSKHLLRPTQYHIITFLPDISNSSAYSYSYVYDPILSFLPTNILQPSISETSIFFTSNLMFMSYIQTEQFGTNIHSINKQISFYLLIEIIAYSNLYLSDLYLD